MSTITLVRVTAVFCDLCLSGKGGYCNVPGCALIRNRAPDIPWKTSLEDVHCSWEIDGVTGLDVDAGGTTSVPESADAGPGAQAT